MDIHSGCTFETIPRTVTRSNANKRSNAPVKGKEDNFKIIKYFMRNEMDSHKGFWHETLNINITEQVYTKNSTGCLGVLFSRAEQYAKTKIIL